MTSRLARFGTLPAMAFAVGFLGTAHGTYRPIDKSGGRDGISAPGKFGALPPSGGPAIDLSGTWYPGTRGVFRPVVYRMSGGAGYGMPGKSGTLMSPADDFGGQSGGGSVDLAPPIVMDFVIPSTCTSLDVPILGLMAIDDVGVTGYMITQSPMTPFADDAGWSAWPPDVFVASGQGTVTLWAWAKDAAGNVSAGVSATTTVTQSASSIGADLPSVSSFQNRVRPARLPFLVTLGCDPFRVIGETGQPAEDPHL